MFEFLKTSFGIGEKTDFSTLIKQGATIVDVRSPEEYQDGHIKGSVNIPLQILSNRISSIPKQKAVITCCASGMRSASAKQILEANGFTEIYNGGGWRSLNQKLA